MIVKKISSGAICYKLKLFGATGKENTAGDVVPTVCTI
jgi:hypothetical protein